MKTDELFAKIDTVNDITSAKSPRRIELSEKLFSTLSEVMNEVHSSSFSLRFWKMLLTDHVNAVISRKELLEKKEHYRNPDLYAINGYTFPSTKQKLKKSLIRTVKHFKTFSNKTLLFETIKNNDELMLGFPPSRALDEENLGFHLPNYYNLMWGFGERNKREIVNDIADRFDDVYLKNVVRELPKNIVEHFQKMFADIPMHNPEEKTFHVHLQHPKFNWFVVTKYVEYGAKFYWYQHGSEYGEFTYDYSHHLSHDLADEFRTWGWQIKEKDVPWKAYRLEAFKDKYNKYSSNKTYDILICYPAMDHKRVESYKNFTKQLLSALDKDKYPKLLARPRRTNKLHSHASQLSFINDRRVEVSSGLQPMMKEMSQCKLVLQMNVPATNFLECLYVDHLTIGILRNDQPTDIIKPFYSFFKNEGVLHDNIHSLVEHLNNIDIEEWWEELKKKPGYKRYKNTFARKI